MKNVLITGANRGLGLALAKQFEQEDCALFLVVRSETARQELNKSLPHANVLVSDVTEDEHEARLATFLADVALDVVINNAGSGTKAPSLESTQVSYLRKEFDTNCVGVLTTVKGSLTALKRSNAPLIINISSRRGSLGLQAEGAAKGSGCSYSYRVSKAAQNMLTLCLADDLEDFGITVAAIHPGRLLTTMAAKDAHMTPESAAQQIAELVMQKQLKNRDFISLEAGRLPW